MRVALSILTLAGVLSLSACHRRRWPELPVTVPVSPPLEPAAPWTLPTDWASMPALEFETTVERELPETAITPLAPASLDALRLALDAMDVTSVRAAVILGRSRSDEAGNAIANRLLKRVQGPHRSSDAGDCVAAAAIAGFPRPERWYRLMRLVEGFNPHPDLEVRVETACAMLRMGIDRVIPFLLRIVRIGTWDGQADELDFVPPDNTAWIRGRAAEALSIRAGLPLRYDPDAPIAHREREARRLADVLDEIAASASVVDPRGWPEPPDDQD